jgi:hemerythrin superfamily protein
MSILDKVVEAMTPTETEAQRLDARVKARGAAMDGDWLSLVLLHHQQIESAFEAVKAATDSTTRVMAQKRLALVLTGHAIAEEAVLYPALVKTNEEGHSTKAYTEQSEAKVQMSLLEDLPPMSQEYVDKLEHIREAVAHHVYEEEGHWFLELRKKLPPADQVKLTFRYQEEYSRYTQGRTDPESSGLRRVVLERSLDEARGREPK